MKVFPLFKNTIFTQNIVAGDSHCADKDLGYESGCKQQVNEEPEQQALCQKRCGPKCRKGRKFAQYPAAGAEHEPAVKYIGGQHRAPPMLRCWPQAREGEKTKAVHTGSN